MVEYSADKMVSEKTKTTLRYLTSATACLVYVAEGLVFTVPEPTLLQLRDVAGTSIAGISLIFSIRSVGGLVGSLMTGFWIKNWHRDVMIGLLTIIMALALGIVPWCSNLPIMLCAFFVQGYGIGYIETNANVLVKDIWLDDSAPALQALYLFFLLGSFLAPLMGVPFLSKQEELPKACEVLKRGNVTDQDKHIATWCDDLMTSEDDSMDLPSLKKFYIFVTVLCVLFGVLMVIFGVLVERYVLQGSHTGDEEVGKPKQSQRWVHIAVLVLITVSGGLFIGSELNYAGFLTAFVVMQLRGTYAEGIYITSTFWGVYTVAAIAAVAFAKYIRASKMIFMCCITMTIGLIILVAGAHTSSLLWVGTIIFGIGCSATYGGIFVLADDYLILTSTVSAVVVSGTTVGEFLVPLLSGLLFEMNPMSLMYLTLACILVSDVGFVLMEVLVQTKGHKRTYTADDDMDQSDQERTELLRRKDAETSNLIEMK